MMTPYAKDLLERVSSTFAAGMVAAMVATGDVDLTDPKVWTGGALAGALSVLKGIAARFAHDPDTASLVK